MLAVVMSPHGFTTALASEASIVPRASYRQITLAACLGRVLGAEPQVSCHWFDSHSSSYSFVSHPPSQTGLDPFDVIRLSSPCFRNDAVDVPAWISSWHFRHTISVLRRLAAICLTHAGFSLRPGFSRSASLRIWWTSTFSFEPQSSHVSASTL